MRLSWKYTKDLYRKSKLRTILIWTLEISLVLILAAITAIFFCQGVVMQEGSMEPTVSTNEKILINRAAYRIGNPKRGDIIAFKNGDEQHASVHIKRIIGLPGETIQIKDGMILINGETYMEKKDFPKITNPGIAKEPMKLKQGEYFVLGDNRNNSEDSRFGDTGSLKKRNIIGKLWFVVSPRDGFGLLKS